MAEVPAGQNTHVGDGALLRECFITKTVSSFENEVGAPRFYAQLPRKGVRRILDFGCGPSGPAELRAIYPQADILGTDISEDMLPGTEHEDHQTHYTVWDGERESGEPYENLVEQFGKFDLIILKLVAHYLPLDPNLNLASITKTLTRLLRHGGSLAISVPHPDQSAQFANEKSEYRGAAPYVGTVGSTSHVASMVHRSLEFWVGMAMVSGLADHMVLIDEPADAAGYKKRLNVLFCPKNTNTDSIYWRLQALQGRQPTKMERLKTAALHLIGRRLVSRLVWKAPYFLDNNSISDRTLSKRQRFFPKQTTPQTVAVQ